MPIVKGFPNIKILVSDTTFHYKIPGWLSGELFPCLILGENYNGLGYFVFATNPFAIKDKRTKLKGAPDGHVEIV